jgi:hypothetical protein
MKWGTQLSKLIKGSVAPVVAAGRSCSYKLDMKTETQQRQEDERCVV